MSADWKAGDRALCVDDSDCYHTCDIPVWIRRGTVYLVAEIIVRGSDFDNPGIALAFQENPARTEDGKEAGFRCERFRKLIPACDRITISEEQKARQ